MVDGNHGKGGEGCNAVPTAAIVQRHCGKFWKVLPYKKINNACQRVLTHLHRQYWLPRARRDQQDLIPGAADRAAAPGNLH